jgi:hypothetical protein
MLTESGSRLAPAFQKGLGSTVSLNTLYWVSVLTAQMAEPKSPICPQPCWKSRNRLAM